MVSLFDNTCSCFLKHLEPLFLLSSMWWVVVSQQGRCMWWRQVHGLVMDCIFRFWLSLHGWRRVCGEEKMKDVYTRGKERGWDSLTYQWDGGFGGEVISSVLVIHRLLHGLEEATIEEEKQDEERRRDVVISVRVLFSSEIWKLREEEQTLLRLDFIVNPSSFLLGGVVENSLSTTAP